VWDTEQQYTRDRLELYYLSHSGKPISEEHLTEVDLTTLCLHCPTDHSCGRQSAHTCWSMVAADPSAPFSCVQDPSGHH
jgi:hypothetical protein